jgi:hypothetical protein
MTVPQPGPWTDYSTPEREPWKGNAGVVKFLEFPVRLPALSRRAFQLYWTRHHSCHVMNVTAFSQFMKKYVAGLAYTDPVPGLPAHYRQGTPFDGASEVWLGSLAEVDDWLSCPSYAELIQPDESRFLSQEGLNELLLGKEERLYEPDPDLHEQGLTKVYLLLNALDPANHDGAHAGISDMAKDILARESLRRCLKKLVVTHRLRPPAATAIPVADIDAVLELWFDDLTVMAAFFADDAYVEHQQQEPRWVDTARIRALVARMHVVHDEFSFQPSTTQPLPFHREE